MRNLAVRCRSWRGGSLDSNDRLATSAQQWHLAGQSCVLAAPRPFQIDVGLFWDHKRAGTQGVVRQVHAGPRFMLAGAQCCTGCQAAQRMFNAGDSTERRGQHSLAEAGPEPAGMNV